MEVCVENLDAIIKKYKPLLISTVEKFPVFDRNEAYIKACDYVLCVIESFDPKKGNFGGYLKYRLYYYFLSLVNEEKIDSLNDKDKKGREYIELLNSDVNIEDDLIKKVEIKFLHDAILKLNKRQRDILYLKYDKNFSHKEIGKLLGISPKTVTNVHCDAIFKLRRILRQWEIYS